MRFSHVNNVYHKYLYIFSEEKGNPSEILTTATRKIHEKYNFFEMTLQIEYYQPKMQNCTQCQVPK